MKTKKLIVDGISLLLAIELFYEAVTKLFALENYRAFLLHMPYTGSLSWVLAVLIPIVELGLAIGLVFSKRPVTFLLAATGALVIFVVWICCVHFIEHVISWPFYGSWPGLVWLQKIIMALVMTWLALIAAWLTANPGKPAGTALA